MINNIFFSFWNTCKKTIDFKSRSSRREYFYYYIMLVFIGLLWLPLQYLNSISAFITLGLLFFKLFIWLSGISLNIRRLHDANFSGKWYILYLVLFFVAYFFIILVNKEIVYAIITLSYATIILQVIAFIFFKGTPGPNKYGPPPEY